MTDTGAERASAPPPVIHAPAPEVRAAASPHLRPLQHSIGLVVMANEPPDGAYSFRVEGAAVTPIGGWGWAGRVPEIADLNPPPNLIALHTVVVVGDPQAAEAGVRRLIDEHIARYGDCRVWWAAKPTPLPDVRPWPSRGSSPA